jgi:O-antigen ligase
LPSLQQANEKLPSRAGNRDGVDVFCERAILIIVALILVWGPLAFGALPATGFLGIQGLTILALGLWAVRMWTQRPFRLFWAPMCWAVLAFLVYALVRCQVAELTYPARQELVHAVVYASLFFVILHNLNRRESATVITVCLIAVGTALSFFAVFQFATKYPWIWGMARRPQFIERGSGTYINPDHLAGFLGMVIPLALAYTIMSRLRPTFKVLMGYCVLVMLVGVGVTMSRGGILAVGLMLVVFCGLLLFQRGLWRASLAIMGVLFILGLGVNAEFGDKFQRRFDAAFQGDKVFDPREQGYWPAAVEIFKRHVLWGSGPGSFDAEFSLYRPPSVQSRPVYAHNDYLNTLSDWGVTGMAIITTACGLLFWGAFNTWKSVRKNVEIGSSNSDKAAFVMGATMGLLALLFHSVVDFNMHIPANAVVAVTLMALITAHGRFATERFWKNPGRIGKLGLTVSAMLAVVYLAIEGERAGRETYWLGRAIAETTSWKGDLAALTKAYQAEPDNYETSYSIGEYFRSLSEQGNSDYKQQAEEAMKWYAKSMALNPYYAFNPMRYGMCLDWIGESDKATHYFDLAEKLDHNNFYIAVFVGRHYVELGDYLKAQQWFGFSLSLSYNQLALWNLDMINKKLTDSSGLFKK